MTTVANPRRKRQPKTAEHYREALDRARAGHSEQNIMAVYMACAARGFDDIRPYGNVLTFDAWRALGRTVKRGEHGVKITVYVPFEVTERDEKTGAEKTRTATRPRTATVFHVSQTDAWEGGAA